MGISLAMICGRKGYRVKVLMPENVTQERTQLLRMYGAEIVYSEGSKGSNGAVEKRAALEALHDGDAERYLDHKADQITLHATQSDASKPTLCALVRIIAISVRFSRRRTGRQLRQPATDGLGRRVRVGRSSLTQSHDHGPLTDENLGARPDQSV
jgi:hypothetical protein